MLEVRGAVANHGGELCRVLLVTASSADEENTADSTDSTSTVRPRKKPFAVCQEFAQKADG